MSLHVEDPSSSSAATPSTPPVVVDDNHDDNAEAETAAAAAPRSPPTIYHDSTAAAIANFRPSPREIINGIAPHVFNDQRSLRRRRRSSRTTKPYWYTQHNGGAKSSPLRVQAVISWDDHSIYLEPSENDDTRDVIRRASEDGRSTQQQPPLISKPNEVPRKLDKSKSPRRGFRIDIPLLKTFVIKLKPARIRN